MLVGEYKKRSFLRFREKIDKDKLVDEYRSIPGKLWVSSYWGSVHCSVGTILLRGGNTGTMEDFACAEVFDHDILEQLPYIKHLVSSDGPFGGAVYAFIFRMMPHGVTLAHRDLNDAWTDKFRVHIPITTNKDAVLLSDGKAMHFSPGYAWSFDNYSVHGVVNGGTERTHLIMDVPVNEKFAKQLRRAEYLPGYVDEAKLSLIADKDGKTIVSYPGDPVMIETINNLKANGLDAKRIAVLLNERRVPTKCYNSQWTEESIFNLIPIIMW